MRLIETVKQHFYTKHRKFQQFVNFIKTYIQEHTGILNLTLVCEME